MKNSIFYSFLLCAPLISVPVQASNPELNISADKAHAISEHGRALASVGRLHDKGAT